VVGSDRRACAIARLSTACPSTYRVAIEPRGQAAGATCHARNRLNNRMDGVIVRFVPRIDDRVPVRCMRSGRDLHASKRH
jgi:hypothetical protein